jgi:hypothetical protein
VNPDKKLNDRKIWFPAKKYGWGWGFPCAWQGWGVLTIFMAVVFAAVKFLPPSEDLLMFSLFVILASAALIFICFIKGEKPGWRWGK